MQKTDKEIIEILDRLDEMAMIYGFELWRKICGYDNYSVSSKANVRNDKSGKILKPRKNGYGYLLVNLYNDGKMKTFLVHRLVAIAFIPNPENKKCVDHIDTHPLNNNLINLRWATNQENCMNQSIACNNTSGTKGVVYDKTNKKWKAQISIDGINKHIGLYDNLEDAVKARQQKANETFGDYTNSCEK